MYTDLTFSPHTTFGMGTKLALNFIWNGIKKVLKSLEFHLEDPGGTLSLDCQLKKHRMTLEVELVWFGCQTCSDPLLFYHLSEFRISPGSSLFQILFGCATTNNMHVCTPVCVCESLPAVKQQVGPGSAFLIDLQVTGCVRGLIASLSAPHLPSLSSIQSLSFLSLFLVLSSVILPEIRSSCCPRGPTVS